jgi:hypothetical protein
MSITDFYKFHFRRHLFDYIQHAISSYSYPCYCFSSSHLTQNDLKEIARPIGASLTIQHDEATSLYCQSLLPEQQQRKHTYFLQLHVLEDECRLLLNHVFATHSSSEGIYKYIQSKGIPISILDKVGERLWTYIQEYPDSLTRCHHHHTGLFTCLNKAIAVPLIKKYILKVTFHSIHTRLV